MKNFEVIIGIEVHIVLNTKTKMFSSATNTHYAQPNTEVAWMDLALPGILPMPNKAAIEKGIILADALKMKINYENIQFDRKNYFYMDLPKGFQITQQHYPIGSYGEIQIGKDKKITIERIHLEEDTAKKTSVDNNLLMDYNRAGIPLIEIVTTPCIHSADEAYEYLSALKRLLIFKNISDAKMEDGSMRADVNISLRPEGATWYGNKVEIKNINSLSNVKKAIEFEIKRQQKLILTNEPIQQETRRFDDTKGTTEFMRAKTNAIDYRYITEPNIINCKLSEETVKEILKNANKDPWTIAEKLHQKCQLNESQINLLLDNYNLYKLYDRVYGAIGTEPLQIYNWISNELIGLLDKLEIALEKLEEFYIQEFIILMQKLFVVKEINQKQAKSLLAELFAQHKAITDLIKELGFTQITDEKIIGDIIQKYMQTNADMLAQYNDRPERVEKFFVGMVMKETNSQANPNITMDVLKRMLKQK